MNASASSLVLMWEHAHKMIRQEILVTSKCTTKIYNDGEHTHDAGDYDNGDSILGTDYSRNFQS